MDKKKILFHLRPWEVGLYVALEDYLNREFNKELDFLYITHHFEAESLLKKRGRDCININSELKKIPFPIDWRERLQELENQCRGFTRNFQQYLAAERFFNRKSRDIQIKQLYRTLMFYNPLFEKHKPFFMLSNGPDHMPFWIAMDLLKFHGGHPCGLVPASWPKNSFSMYREVGRIYYGQEIYNDLLTRGLTAAEQERAKELQQAFVTGRSVPINISSERFALIRTRSFIQRIKSYYYYNTNDFYWQITERIKGNWYVQKIPFPGRYILNKIRNKYNFIVSRRFFNETVVQGVPFVYFPLHLEPEATTTIYSNFYDNQLEVIRALSKALPVSWLIAVKEHPNMKHRRSKDFYRSLKKMPNVVMVKTYQPSWQLIRDCEIVATLSGTAGIEASIIGKPVIVFGKPAWGYSPTVTEAGNLQNLHETIWEAYRKQLSPDDERVQAFILSWEGANQKGIYDHFAWLPPIDDPDNVVKIGQAILKLIHDIESGNIS